MADDSNKQSDLETTSKTSPSEEAELPSIGVEETGDGTKVLVDKVQLDSILQYIQQQQKKENVSKLLRPKFHTAKVRLVDEDRLVVGYGKTWEKVELGGRKFLTIQVFTKKITDCVAGSEVKPESHEKEYIKFMEEGIQLEGRILGKQVEEEEEDLGYINKTKVDYDKFRSETTDEEVPMVVRSIKLIYTLRLPDGREVVLPEEALN